MVTRALSSAVNLPTIKSKRQTMWMYRKVAANNTNLGENVCLM